MLILFWVLIFGAVLIRKPRIFPILITIFLMEINYNNLTAADYTNYSNIYNNISKSDLYQTGYGWYFLNNMGRDCGLNYNEYKILTIVICCCCIWVVSEVLVGKKEINLIAGFYLLYPALIDTIQIRFFTATTLVLLGIPFLIKKKVWSTIVFAFIVIIASSIHTSVLFYLIFAIYPVIEKLPNKFRYAFLILTLILLLFRDNLYKLVMYFSNERQIQYFDPSAGVTSGSGFLLPIAILSIVIIYFINNRIFEIIKSDVAFSTEDKDTAATIRGISLIMFLLIPLIILSGELFRVFRIIFILSYIMIGILSKRNIYSLKCFIYNGKPIKVNNRILGLIIAFIAFAVNILYLAPGAFASYFK